MSNKEYRKDQPSFNQNANTLHMSNSGTKDEAKRQESTKNDKR